MATLRIFLLLLAIWANQSWGATQEPMPLRLLRTVFVGAPQLPLDDIQRYAKNSHTHFYGHVLARSALIVLGEKNEWTATQSVELLERCFELLDTAQSSLFIDVGMRPAFGTDDVIFTLVYALVQSGQGDQAITVLAGKIDSSNDFTRAVALQALRYVGTPRSSDVLKGRGREGKDAQLRTNLLADTYFPFFDDLYRRQAQIPRVQRDRRTLLTFVKEGCSERAVLAIHLLGFMAPAEEAGQQQTELEALRAASGLGCYYSRYFALRSLALRRDGDAAFWIAQYQNEKDVWVRTQLVRSAYTLFGRSILKQGLDMLATEPAQHVQWELLYGNLALRQGHSLRDEWDLWIPATLNFRLDHQEPATALSSRHTGVLLNWLEQGKRPENKIVRNILFWELVGSVPLEQTRHFLRALDRQPDKSSAWWVLVNLKDPDALPILRYWQTLAAEKDQLDALKSAISNLEAQVSQGKPGASTECCSPERTCLISHVLSQNLTVSVAPIKSEKQAHAWLVQKRGKQGEVDIRFTDPLERMAEVRVGTAALQKWEHLYGCWQRVDIQQSRLIN